MNENLRKNFKSVRERLFITQSNMAEYLGLEQSMISKFEKGERNLNVNHIERACNLFGIDLNVLYQNNVEENLLAPSFRSTKISIESFEDIAEINKLALNLVEMKKIKGDNNGQL